MGNPLKTRYRPICYHTKFGHCRSNRFGIRRALPKNWGLALGQTVWAHVWVRKKIKDGGAPPPLDGGVGDPPRNTLLPHMCHRTKFGRCSAVVQPFWGSPKIFWDSGAPPWDVGMADPLETGYPICLIMAILVILGQTAQA